MQNIVTIILFLTSVRRDTDFVFCKSFIVNQSFSKAVALMRLTPRIAFQNRKVGLVKSYRCVAKRRQIKKHSCSTKRVLQFPLPTAVRFVVEMLLRYLNLNRRKRHYKKTGFRQWLYCLAKGFRQWLYCQAKGFGQSLYCQAKGTFWSLVAFCTRLFIL